VPVELRRRYEARWFVASEVGAELATHRPGRCRVDAYHVPSLTPATSVKWRGDAALVEHKRRLGRVELVTWCGVPGFGEQWVKQRQPRRRPPGGAAWREVSKEVWTRAGVEVARFVVGGEEFWTVCVDLACAGEPSGPARRWWRSQLAGAEPSSYAAFLAALPGTGRGHLEAV
jgi:hypothetical protein